MRKDENRDELVSYRRDAQNYGRELRSGSSMPGAGNAEDYLSVEIHQATGMIAAQANCDMIEAFARLRIRATAMDQSLHDTALDVIDRIIRFDD